MGLRYESDIQEFGRQIFSRMGKKGPSIFAKDYWQGQMMEWSMRNEAFKTEMFRFVDVFPVLTDHADVARHLQEYFCRPGQDFPKAFQWGLSAVSPESRVARIAAGQIEKNISSMAYRFIAGTSAEDALPKLTEMREQGIGFTVDLLGEACVSEAEAEAYENEYIHLVHSLHQATASWQEDPRVEGKEFPRVNLSVKLSALYSHLDPIDQEGSIQAVLQRLRPVFRAAKERGVLINVDAESYKYKDICLTIFKRLLEEPEFADGPQVGTVIQAYLKDSAGDLKDLIKWARKKKRRLTVRLVKGAYWDYEMVHALQEGWPIPVYTDKRDTDVNYEELTTLLMDNTRYVIPAIASHNVRSLAHAMAYAKKKKLGRDDWEVQMLYGMAEPLKTAVTSMGYRLRDYVPVGQLIPGMAYLVRRLLENTSNESWLRQGFAEGLDEDQLLSDPRDKSQPSRTHIPDPLAGAPTAPGTRPFYNEAMLDFTHAHNRESYQKALATVQKKKLGQHHPLVIDGKTVDTGQKITVVDPASPGTVLGTVASAGVAEADLAIGAAKKSWPEWRDTPYPQRARLLLDVAAQLRRDRKELAALMTYEVGKQWREADADVCEAIDFLEFYAREMMRLGAGERLGQVPGELNHIVWESRGVAAVIAPWNFPLAILTGMTAAAVVTGNTVVMKPAEQSPLIAAELMAAFQRAGVPDGVLNFLPGPGETVGSHLVDHPDVSVIAFTGSMEVGLGIYARAAQTAPAQHTIKRVICELGGKNAIIVDSDADLDEAVEGVVMSAFGFQGQKCSACSRAIVLEGNYNDFINRLLEAVRSLPVGPAIDPHNKMGPVVEKEAQERILRTIEKAKQDGATLAVQAAVPPGDGFYVPPTVFTDVDPQSDLAQNEIFGPVLAVLQARDMDHALEIALDTRFALTGGIYSRSPLNIQKARAAFRVGNLYINRKITGALVWRNPFGGFKRSGLGTKAGGNEYLQHFMDPRAITENTMRRGFAPTE